MISQILAALTQSGRAERRQQAAIARAQLTQAKYDDKPGGINYVDERAIKRGLDTILGAFIMADKVKMPNLGDRVMVNVSGTMCMGMVTKVHPDNKVNAAVFSPDGTYVGGMVDMPYVLDAGLSASWAWTVQRV